MRKKIILFIVEGPSDEIALGSVFINLFSNDKVLIDVIHGDITSDNNITPSNIMGKLGDNIRNYLKLKGLGKTDLQRVIHIVDIDGAYIEDSSVIQDDNCQKIRYTTQSIFTAHKDKIIERNSKKRANLDYISTKDTIFTKIPYQVFYMSSNLDHVLYNELNSIDILSLIHISEPTRP